MIGTDCTGSCKSNYHTITTTTVPCIHGCIYIFAWLHINKFTKCGFCSSSLPTFVLFPVIRIETTIKKCDTDLLNSIPTVGRVWRYQSDNTFLIYQGRIQDFKLGGAHLKKLRQAREARKLFGYFVWKITILRQKIIFFQF